MDRNLLEGDPHSIVEGMVIGAYAIGAHEGYVYMKSEYAVAPFPWKGRSLRPRSVGCWAGISSAPALISPLKSVLAGVPLSAGNQPLSWLPSKEE